MFAPAHPRLTFKPLAPTFGAECSGVDFSQPIPAEEVQAIYDGMAKYGVLVFRSTALDDARHVAFASQFGELEDASAWIQPGQNYRLAPYIELADVGNVEDDGRVASVESPRHQINRGNSLFHVDNSYNSRRAFYSLLRADKLPPAGTGGGTAFADSRTAYDDLDSDIKEKIEDLVLAHSVWHSRVLGAPDSKLLKQIVKQIKPEEQAMARHKLVQLHEPSGRKTMYIAWHAHHVDGWSKEDSQPLIESLMRHATQDKYTFQVDWENEGDLVMWDNTCVMHRACGGSYQGKYIRDMRRATVKDSSPTAWGLNEQDGARQGLFGTGMKGKLKNMDAKQEG